ncbi:TPA: hypothetical protein EYP26_03695 [Candidatus Bathyarchaeota archaeon]|nr:hypothetical protein [Candidatus Bathyarchaeota archaeon]
MSAHGKEFKKPLGSPEWESFKNFAVASYKEAVEIAQRSTINPAEQLVILEKAASPLVYLWREWAMMSLEEKLVYATEEYRRELEGLIEERDEALRRAEERGFGKR